MTRGWDSYPPRATLAARTQPIFGQPVELGFHTVRSGIDRGTTVFLPGLEL